MPMAWSLSSISHQHDDDLIKMIRENVSDFSVVPPELFWSQLFFQLIPVLGDLCLDLVCVLPRFANGQ